MASSLPDSCPHTTLLGSGQQLTPTESVEPPKESTKAWEVCPKGERGASFPLFILESAGGFCGKWYCTAGSVSSASLKL